MLLGDRKSMGMGQPFDNTHGWPGSLHDIHALDRERLVALVISLPNCTQIRVRLEDALSLISSRERRDWAG
jgi:hypothetical protein